MEVRNPRFEKKRRASMKKDSFVGEGRVSVQRRIKHGGVAEKKRQVLSRKKCFGLDQAEERGRDDQRGKEGEGMRAPAVVLKEKGHSRSIRLKKEEDSA